MLRFLRIRDFALIRSLEIELDVGLTVLTGETGSGKSIIVDALGLLVGGRSSQDLIRSECDTAILEGVFSVEPEGTAVQLLREAGIEADDDSIVIRREISAAGRSRVFINNSLTTLSLLRSIGALLADIHGQQDHQALYDLGSHLGWLDRYAGHEEAIAEVRALYSKLRTTAQRLDSLNLDEQERLRRVDILQFQVDEIRRANLRPQEREELEAERLILANRERIFTLASESYGLLYEDEPSIVGQARRLARILDELAGFDPSWRGQLEMLQESLYKLEDLAYTVRDCTTGIDFSPGRLEEVEQRLVELERLSAKYGRSAEEILAYAERCEKELEQLVAYADNSRILSEALQEELKCYMDRAESLSAKRRSASARLERELRREFRSLAMDKMAFSVAFHSRERPDPSDRIPACCGPGGVDRVEFLVAPNKGEEMRPLARIASGGELSRVMLAIKALCGGGDPGKTLVFDEIDAGIGGRVAEVVGRRMRGLAEHNQVLCVTHLAQITAFAANHCRVWKDTVGNRTETFIARLKEAERVEELARMMGGEVITETSRRHAREMLALSGSPVKGAAKQGEK